MIKTSIRASASLAIALTAQLWAQTFETLHQFTGENGRRPETAMTVGPDGALYGTTREGGANNVGVIYRYSPTEGFSTVAEMNAATLGGDPLARLLNIGDGNLYGACRNGNAGANNGGTVFKIDPLGQVSTILNIPAVMGAPYRAVYLASGEPNVLHVLCEDNSGILRVPLDGGTVTVSTLNVGTPKPQSFIRASDGFLYGATIEGGNRSDGDGTLFRTDPDGTNYITIHDFVYQNGSEPKGAMVQGRDGNLYGVTTNGGTGNEVGVVYRLTKTAADEYSYSVIHRFSDFDESHGDLLLATDGMLYGTGKILGPGGNGNGGIWRMRTDGSGYKVLHTFASGVGTTYPTGRNPVGGLVQGPDGHIYGTTVGGIGAGFGTIFRLKGKLPPPPINRAPIAVNDLGTSIGTAVAINVLANDFDPDGDTLTLTVKTQPERGTAEVQLNGTILYTPDGTYAGADSFTYEVSDQRGGKSVASVQITSEEVPPLFVAGSYQGLISLDENLDGTGELPRGQFALKVDASRKFTGTLFTSNKRLALKGTFSAEGTAVVKVTLPNKAKADVFLTFQAGHPSTILAAVFANENWTGEAGPVRAPDPAATQRFTVQIFANPLTPQHPLGHGYATITMKPDGTVTAIGKLGDGSNLKWATAVTELPGSNRVIPVYSEPLKQGYISGLLSALGNPGADFEGALAWSRPAAAKSTQPYALGFTSAVDARVARFIPPGSTAPALDISGGLVELAGTDLLPTPVSGTFTTDGKKIKTIAPLKAFTINRTTGLFSGTMQSGGKTIAFKGAVNQALANGFGYFSANGVTGSVAVGVEPNE